VHAPDAFGADCSYVSCSGGARHGLGGPSHPHNVAQPPSPNAEKDFTSLHYRLFPLGVKLASPTSTRPRSGSTIICE